MTSQERTAIEASGVVPMRPAVWADDAPAGWALLKAKPCPYLDRDEKGLAVCRVYVVRPFNCRRFGCFRPSPELEPLELDNTKLGCKNLSDRIANSPEVLRAYRKMQRDAQGWAVAHGWKNFKSMKLTL
jgi:Fe-S-cluster containining protein